MSRIFELLRQSKLDGELLQGAVTPTATTNSRNFELLQQARKDELLFDDGTAPLSVPPELAPALPARYSGGGETFKLVQRLFLGNTVLAPRVVAFCAVEERSEDNWTSAQAAELLAANVQDSSVCLVDANLARPSLHHYFDVKNCGGLAGAMLENGPVTNFIQPVDGGRFRLMSAGVTKADTESGLASSRLRARIIELRGKFNYILIDAPPLTKGSTTALLATLVDGFLLLVEPSFTPQQAAREAKDNIEAAGGRVLGVVLHRRELPFEARAGKGKRGSKKLGFLD